MARVFFDPDLPLRITRGLPDSAIEGLPLDVVRQRLNDVRRQRLVPFLGAGASLPQDSPKSPPAPHIRPDETQLDKLCEQFSLQNPIQRSFIGIAIQVAQSLQSDSPNSLNLAEAPSSWELANLLAHALHIDPFESYGEALWDVIEPPEQRPTNPQECRQRLGVYLAVVRSCARLLGLSQSVPQLLTIASYHNSRDQMIGLLTKRFQKVAGSNVLHATLADSAKSFVQVRNKGDIEDRKDFVIITTNYDRMIEHALDAAEVPTCVVTVSADPSLQVVISFPVNTQKYLQLSDRDFEVLKRRYTENERLSQGSVSIEASMFTPKKFQLANKTHSLAMVYKIHGSLEPGGLAGNVADGLVISDCDYVEFLQNNGTGNELIPAYIFSRLMESRLLFLGYSFADWNVRTLYRYFLHNRRLSPGRSESPEAGDRDFVIMRSFGVTDELFFQTWDVSVLVVDLKAFATKLVGSRVSAS